MSVGTRVTVPRQERETIPITLQQEEARIEYEQTVREAEATIQKLRDNPSQYTLEGKRVTGGDIDRLQRELDQYKRDYTRFNYEVEQQKRSIINREQYPRTPTSPAEQMKRATAAVYSPEQRDPRLDVERQQFYEYIQDIGPPAPDEYTAEMRMRREAGLPQSGLPGPAQPTGITQKLRERVSEKTAAWERRFSVIEDIRQKGRELGLEAREPLKEGKPANVLKATAGAGLQFTASFYDTLTLPIRPLLLGKTVVGATTLATSKKARETFVADIAADPTGALGSVVGGYGGGIVLSNILSLGEPPGQAAMRRKVQAEQKALQRQQKLASRYTVEQQLPFERELGMDYPTGLDEFESTMRAFEKRYVKLSGEQIDLDMPYYSKVDAAKKGGDYGNVLDVPDEWKPGQVTELKDTLLPYESSGQIGVVKTDARIRPMKPLLYPEEATVSQTSKPVLSLEKTLEFTKEIRPRAAYSRSIYYESQYSYGLVKIKAAPLGASSIISPLSLGVSVKDYANVMGLPKQAQGLRQSVKSDVSMRNILDIGLASKQVSKQVSTPRSIPAVAETPIQIPTQSIVQIPVTIPVPDITLTPKQTTRQIPDVTIAPPPPIFTPGTPTGRIPPTIPNILAEPKKKTSKKRKRGKSGIIETRVDPLFSLKEVLKA